MQIVADTRDNPQVEATCILTTYDIIERNENTVKLVGETGYVEGGVFEFLFEVSGETMTGTIIESPFEDEVGMGFTLSSVGEIPIPTDESSCDIS